MGVYKERKNQGRRKSSSCVEKTIFRLSPSGRNDKTPLGSNSTRSVSYHHFGWAFPSSSKRQVDEGRPIAVKTLFFGFSPSGRNEKKPRGPFKSPPFWVGFSKQRKKPGWRRSSNFLQNLFFRPSPSGRNEKTPFDRIPRGRFHTTILGGLFQAAQKAGFSKVVQLR